VFGQGGNFVSNAPNGDASPTNQTLYGALSVMVDGSNSLYISDTNNSRILAYPSPYNPPGVNETPPPVGELSVSEASLRFDGTAIGKSRTREVRLSNSGTTQIAIGVPSAAGDFTLSGDCGAILLPGQTCTVRVTFTPTAKGRRGGMVYVKDNAYGAPHLVHLIGHATARRRHR
jgi:hypothetical protein